MKKKYLSLVCVGVCFLLSSCKIELSSVLKVSELLSSETKNVNGIVSVEISSCYSYEDSRQPSSSLLEVQQKITNIIPSAEYVQCYSKAMNSYAEFKINMNVKNNPNLPSSGITLVNDGKGTLGLHIPNNIANQIKESLYGENDVSMIFTIINDTDTTAKFNVLGAFINNKPHPLETEVILQPQQNANIKLSDVAKEYILEGNNFVILKPSSNN